MCHVIDLKEGFCYPILGTEFVGIKRFRIIDGELVNYFTYSPTKWKRKKGAIIVQERERKQKICYGFSALRLKGRLSQIEIDFDKMITAGMHINPFRIKNRKLDYEKGFLPEKAILAIVTFLEQDIVFFDGIDVSVRKFEIKLDEDLLYGYGSKALCLKLKEDLVKLKALFTNESANILAERREENE